MLVRALSSHACEKVYITFDDAVLFDDIVH
jgi:hypothetical protein